jgi:hypothetical protein
MSESIRHISSKYTPISYDLVVLCSAEELQLYLYLKFFALSDKKSLSPSLRRIKSDLGWGKDKVIRVMGVMEAKKRLKVTRSDGETNIYDITWYDITMMGGSPDNVNGGMNVEQIDTVIDSDTNNNNSNKVNSNIKINANDVKSSKSKEMIKVGSNINQEVVSFLSFYKYEFMERISDIPPIFNWGMATKMAKPHIKEFGLDKMKELLLIYLDSNDKFYKDNAYSITCFLSSAILHKLNQK